MRWRYGFLFTFMIMSTASIANALPLEVTRLLNTINSIGVPVAWEGGRSPLCRSGMLGAYIPDRRAIVICLGNHAGDYQELIGTIKHEGWHAVQDTCNNNHPAFDDNVILRYLGPTEKDRSIAAQLVSAVESR